MNREYRIGFDVWGFVLFLLVMLPNFIWFLVPASYDVFRLESQTPEVDVVASFFQVVMVAMICMFIKLDAAPFKLKSPFVLTAGGCCLIYYITWILYYLDFINGPLIIAMCLLPCMAFFFYELDRKNYLSMIPTIGFTICHLIYGLVNHVL